jgi:hypothetical protein
VSAAAAALNVVWLCSSNNGCRLAECSGPDMTQVTVTEARKPSVRHVYSLSTKHCSCGRPQVEGVVCDHGAAAATKYHVDLHTLVAQQLTTAAGVAAYDAVSRVSKLVSSADLVPDGLLPPRFFKARRRPKKKRWRSRGEGMGAKRPKRKVTCSVCKHRGHTARSNRCPAAPTIAARAYSCEQLVYCAEQWAPQGHQFHEMCVA